MGVDEPRMRTGPVELSWAPEERYAVLRFVEFGTGGRREAEELTTALARWVGPGATHFRFLVDCSEMVDVDAGWRATWAEFFKRYRDRSTIAWFNANPRIRLVIVMFQKGTGVTGKTFATEAEARAYLADVTLPS